MKKIYKKIEPLLSKGLTLLKQVGKYTDRYTLQLTACLLAVAVAVLLIPVIKSATDKATMTSGSITDWGLTFGEKNAPPRGNVSGSELKKYDASFMGNTEEKKIWLTFDAGYENGYSAKILDVLKEKNVTATFFLVGHYLKTEPELVKRMVEEGHTVGNHTATHPDMSKLSGTEALRAELEPMETLYYEITGQELPKYYRPPQGKFSTNNLESAKELGYKTVFWSLAYVDWNVNNQPSPQSAINKLNSRIHNGAVVLLHSTSATNADILGSLIDGWKAMGYEFGSIDELFE